MMPLNTNKLRSFEDFIMERGLNVSTLEGYKVAIGMYLAGVASETIIPCMNFEPHSTVQ